MLLRVLHQFVLLFLGKLCITCLFQNVDGLMSSVALKLMYDQSDVIHGWKSCSVCAIFSLLYSFTILYFLFLKCVDAIGCG